jgi:hypothetical protein
MTTMSPTDLAAPGVDHKDDELLIADLVTGYGSLRPVLDLDRWEAEITSQAPARRTIPSTRTHYFAAEGAWFSPGVSGHCGAVQLIQSVRSWSVAQLRRSAGHRGPRRLLPGSPQYPLLGLAETAEMAAVDVSTGVTAKG